MSNTPAAPSGFDVFSMIPQGSQPCKIVNPADGTETGFVVYVQSINSPAVKAVTKRIENARLKKQARGQNFTADEIRQNVIEIMKVAVTGWDWGKDPNGVQSSAGGEQLPFNPGNLVRIAEVDQITAQIDTFMSDDSRFFGHLAKN
jgi:hypothetical protein